MRSALTFAQLYVASLYLRHYEVAATNKDSIVYSSEALSTKNGLSYRCNALIVKSNTLSYFGNILDVAGTVDLRTCEDIVCLAGKKLHDFVEVLLLSKADNAIQLLALQALELSGNILHAVCIMSRVADSIWLTAEYLPATYQAC